MCLDMSSQRQKTPAVTPAPEAKPFASLQSEDRLRRARARGVQANIFTSALGDSGFGASVSPGKIAGATKLGETAAANLY